MTEKEWHELSALLGFGKTTTKQMKRIEYLIKKTEKEDEHPDWYDGWCWCATCRSYAERY